MRKLTFREFLWIAFLLIGMTLMGEGQYALVLPYIIGKFMPSLHLLMLIVGGIINAACIYLIVNKDFFQDMKIEDPYPTPYHYKKYNDNKK